MVVFKDYWIKGIKDALELVEYDVELACDQGVDFFGLGMVVVNDKLYFVFQSDDDVFDSEIAPFDVYLPDDLKLDFKQAFIESYAVHELIDIFKSNKTNDLQVVMDEGLTYFKVNRNGEVIFDYTLW
jgi:hypothetical protein